MHENEPQAEASAASVEPPPVDLAALRLRTTTALWRIEVSKEEMRYLLDRIALGEAKIARVEATCEAFDVGDYLDPDGTAHVFRRCIKAALEGRQPIEMTRLLTRAAFEAALKGKS